MADTDLLSKQGSFPSGEVSENGSDGWRVRVFTLRKGLKLSKERFAVIVGVSTRTVYRWEAGRSAAKSRVVITRIETLERKRG